MHLEIGMGKGDFIINSALKNPNINYIGVEKFSSIIIRAIQKLNNIDISNLKLINIDALNIDKIFNKEIDVLYINFSDPWPKKSHEKRRLTSNEFLEKYDKIFKKSKKIYQKTDNEAFFIYSIESLSNYGYKVKNISFDLHNTDIISVITEYEKKFTKENKKIFYLEAYKD